MFCRDNLHGPISKLRSDVAQIVAVCIKNMLLLSFGLTLGFPTILIPGLQQHDPESSFELSRETISWIGTNWLKLNLNYITSFILSLQVL